jgi:hypothetical protein
LTPIKQEGGKKETLTNKFITMAVQTEIYLSGKLNNLVFYTSGGKKLVRSTPSNVKQSINTVTRSRNFGFAAKAGRVLRSQLEPVIPFPKDRAVQNLFTGAISRWLGLSDINILPPQTPVALIGFSFNQQLAFTDRCKIPFTISNTATELQITIPAFIPAEVFAAPAGTQQVQLSFSLAACGLLRSNPHNAQIKKLEISYNKQLQPAQTVALPALTDPDTLLVLVAAIRFMNEQGMADSREVFLPATVLWAAYY